MRSAWLSALLLLTGCAPDFVEPWEVKKPRLMLAKVVIDGDDEGRARPRPGETFSIELYLMSPERPQASYTGDISTCLGTTLTDGSLACQGDEKFSAIEPLPYAGDDRFVLTGFIVPPFLEQLPPPLDTLDHVSFLGALCVDGSVERVPDKDVAKDPLSTLYRCVDNEASEYPTQLPFTMSVWLDRDTPEGMNHHPTFACDPNESSGACHDGVALDGEQVPGDIVIRLPKKIAGDGARTFLWQAWDANEELPWDACADAPESLPRVHVGDPEYEIFLRFDAGDREPYERTIKVNDHYEQESRREELALSSAITTKGGSLDGFTSVVRYDVPDSEAQAIVKYRPPAKPKEGKEEKDPVPTEGRLVRFYLGVRDQRGGVDFTTRELCLLPFEAPEDTSDD
jgi:hypothetical protein